MAHHVTEDEVLMGVGRLVLLCQSLEAAMRLCTTFVFQGETPLTVSSIEAIDRTERKKTIGRFAHTLRQRVTLRDDFDDFLTGFLERRNQVIHRTEDIPGWSLHTIEGRRVAKRFIDQVLGEASYLLMTFAGFARAWQVQSGLDDPPVPPGGEEFFAWVDREYAPLIDELVHPKDAKPVDM